MFITFTTFTKMTLFYGIFISIDKYFMFSCHKMSIKIIFLATFIVTKNTIEFILRVLPQIISH